MNIERFAKHLKEFTLDEIELIAECDCRTELEQLLNRGKLVFEQGTYKHVEKTDIKYDIFTINESNPKNISVKNAVMYFMNNYAQIFCKSSTIRKYKGIFRYDILPFFKNKMLNEITNNDIRNFHAWCIENNFKPRRVKNTLALLNQLIKYFQNLRIIDRRCIFQVRRVTAKNEFNLNRITFGGNYD